jgi:hypothetical protein
MSVIFIIFILFPFKVFILFIFIIFILFIFKVLVNVIFPAILLIVFVFINDKLVGVIYFFIWEGNFFLVIMRLLIDFGYLLFMPIIVVLFYFINP